MSVNLSFHGAAGTVTGSCYRVDHDNGSFLVDCGMFQGNKTVAKLNNKPFPFDAAALDYMILTHAHIDHTGLMPKLAKNGFKAPVHATKPTIDLLSFMLMDSAKIQESETERRNRKRVREGKEPLQATYTTEHAKTILAKKKGHGYEAWFKPGKGVRARFWNAGHILGSASVEIEIKEKGKAKPVRILFSGDIGPDEKVFYNHPDAPTGFDYVLCEGTYGDRNREDKTLGQRRDVLAKELKDGLDRGGNVLIPAFAVERTQELLHDITVLLQEGRIPEATVYLDSPLARKVTSVFQRHAEGLEDMKISPKELFKHPNFRIVQSVQQSKDIANVKSGAIIMAASGMCEAGRIKHHLRNNLWREDATVLFVGYQSPGTLGSIIRSGKKDIFIHGRKIKSNATIQTISGYSAHADQQELIDWVIERQPTKCALFLTHAEAKGRETLMQKLKEKRADIGQIILPDLDETYTLDPSNCQLTGKAEKRIEAADIQEDWTSKNARFKADLSARLDNLSDEEKRKLIEALQQALNGG